MDVAAPACLASSVAMSARPLVSVIVPAFNAAAFIDAALDSVLSQTYDHLEVLVVDDGSNDDTAAIVERRAAADQRVSLLRQQNQGVAVARNVAAARARGIYLAPLDADDVWFPTKIEKQVRRLEEGGPSVGLAYTWWLGLDQAGAARIRSHRWTIEGSVAESHTAINFIGNASVPLIRKAAFERVGGYEPAFRAAGAQGCEDWDLSLRIAELYQVSLIPEHLCGYRRVAGTMSGSLATMVRSHEMMLERIRQRRPDLPEVLLRWSRGQMYGYVAAIGLRTGNYGAAARWAVKGLLSRNARLSSPWILDILAAKLPSAVSAMCVPLVRRRMRMWH
jgi:glycosyltransferase involved in cell wall biosynthesis